MVYLTGNIFSHWWFLATKTNEAVAKVISSTFSFLSSTAEFVYIYVDKHLGIRFSIMLGYHNVKYCHIFVKLLLSMANNSHLFVSEI